MHSQDVIELRNNGRSAHVNPGQREFRGVFV